MPHSVVAALLVCVSVLLIACDHSPDQDDVIQVEVRSTEASRTAPSTTLDTESSNEIHVDKPVLHWAKPGLAPLFIDEGADMGRGVGDNMFVQVQELMPQYYHVNLSLNYPRLLEELRKGSNVCAILHHTPERAKYMVYSQAVIVNPSYELYISAKRLKHFQETTGWSGGATSFDALMARSEGLKLAITPGQSYGADRDAVLERHADKAEIVRSFADQEAMVKMLAANRVDMVLGFPWVINYRLEMLDGRSDLVKVPLNDVKQYEASYIACADTVLGREAVSSINAISPPVHDRAKSFLPRWLTAKESQLYYGIYHDYFYDGKALP